MEGIKAEEDFEVIFWKWIAKILKTRSGFGWGLVGLSEDEWPPRQMHVGHSGRPPRYTAPLPWHQNRRGKHPLFVESVI